MKLIIFILIVLIIAALLIRIILRSVNQHSPLLMQLHAAGIRTGDAGVSLEIGNFCTLSALFNQSWFVRG